MNKDADHRQAPLPANATIGIMGGGQLGRMLCIAAAELGYRTIILEPDPNAPAAQTANDQIIAAYDDEIALESLADQCDVITYEFENVPADAVAQLAQIIPAHPNAQALHLSQDRLLEKQMAVEIGAQPAPYHAVNSLKDLNAGLEKIGYPAILKTRRLGYDGKGQVKINGPEDVDAAFDKMAGQDAILEGFIEFDREISVIAARNKQGEFAAFDVVENVHENQILATSKVPASITASIQKAAMDIAHKIAEHLDYVGVFAVEFFLAQNNGEDFALYVNEMAPRVHNSGHWTEAACVISQFEQHIRAISGLNLIAPKRHSDCVMYNLIGHDIDQLESYRQNPNAKLHLYGKLKVRQGRKMGHVTIISDRQRSD